MFIALVVVASLILCYFPLGLSVMIVRQILRGEATDMQELLGWPFVLIADLTLYIDSRLQPVLMKGVENYRLLHSFLWLG